MIESSPVADATATSTETREDEGGQAPRSVLDGQTATAPVAGVATGPARPESLQTRLRHRIAVLLLTPLLYWGSIAVAGVAGLEPSYSGAAVGVANQALLVFTTLLIGATILVLRRFDLPATVLRGVETGFAVLFFCLGVSLRVAFFWRARSAPPGPGPDYQLYWAAATNNFWWVTMTAAHGLAFLHTWRRAAVIAFGLSLVPLSIDLGFLVASPDHAGRFGFLPWITIPMLAVGACLTLFDTYRTRQLQDEVSLARREAMEARAVGPYLVRRRLGRGGMGDVYLAEHRLLKRPCAVKFIRPERAGDHTFVRRFELEVKAATRLSHPGAVQVYDYGREADGTFYYVMEYLPGLTLDDVVRRFGPLPGGRVAYILTQVCGALSEAHGLGLIHRDVKPGNVMLCRLGGRADTAKLLDFGLVTDLSGEATRLTQVGGVVGTPAYMAPEQARNTGDVGPASDLYSLGAVAYFLLTGRAPFQADNPLALLNELLSSEAVPPSRVNPGVSDDLEAVVLKLLAKSPADRYPSATALEAALLECRCASAWSRIEAERWWSDPGVAAVLAPPTAEGTPAETALRSSAR